MPIHDWTKVPANIFRGFHTAWLVAVGNELNGGRLPPGYYALPEFGSGGYVADVSARQSGPAAAPTPTDPVARYVRTAARVRRRRTPARRLVVRRADTHRTVAVIELVSPGNKDSSRGFRLFLRKAGDLLDDGVNLLVADLFPPGPRDPFGVHAAVWRELTGRKFTPPPGKPLTLVSYDADNPPTAYVEPLAVGDPLPEVPLMLSPAVWVPAPLEAAYATAWRLFPEVWREVLEGADDRS